MVYLVGAGPGDSGLITQKGLECIKKADVIIYDHLANPTLLSYAKNDCKLIYAGKIAGNHHMVQEEINKTLVEHSRFGNVVRLKGGDPFIFGRGGEESIALIENNIDYEIVPGISSCYSAAEYCGIPVTHRGVATSFHVITGHEKVGNETVNYSALAKLSGTLVFLMGLSSAENISNKLIENGKSENTPVAVISSGTTPHQKCVTGTLNNLSALAKQMTSPAIILVGDVVNLKQDWFKQKNTKILTTATPLMNKSIKNAATDFDITELPLIKTVPINFDLFSKADIAHFSHIVFTSANGVKIFFEYLQKLAVGLYDVLATNVVDFSKGLTSLNNDISFDLKSTDVIYSYMFIASGKGKEDAINLAIVVNKQINNIKNADKSKLTNNADDFYAQSKLIYNNKSGYPDGVVVALIDDIKSKIPVMGLSKEKAADLSKEYQNVDINKIWFDVANKVGAYKEADADCKTKVKHTTNHEKYDSKDSSQAESIGNKSTKNNTTTKVETGGKPVRTEVVPKTTKKTTTRVVTSEFVVPVKTTKPTTTIVDQGGKVVEEEYVDADASKANDDIEYTIAPTKVK